MADPLTRFHETWLGLAQPYEGLVVSIPVLVDAQIGPSGDGAVYERFRALAAPEKGSGRRVVSDVGAFFRDVLGYRRDTLAEPPNDGTFSLFVAEGPETVRPTWVLPHRELGSAEGARPEALVTVLSPEGSLDKPDTTAAWIYPPTAKVERLLRHTRVPLGLLCNGRELRVVFAPEGESTGHVTFRFDDLAKTDGKPLFDAMRALASERAFYGARKGASLRELCEASRTRQLDVTDALASQVLDALEVLVAGFGKAEERDKLGALEAAREDGTLTRGLLTVLLRLVFLLYAEDRGLLPTEHPLFAETYSLFALFARLRADRQAFPDTMAQRFSAYGELLALFRAVYFGVNVRSSEHGPLVMPERKGELFDPARFPFLEGWLAGAAPTVDPEARAELRVPTVDDGTLLTVLEKLIVFEGQRLSYATLDVEQIGSVYEGLMGFDVKLTGSPCVRIGPSRAWVSAHELLEVPARERGKWLQDETGLPKAQAQKLAEAFSEKAEKAEGARAAEAGMEVLAAARVKGTELRGAGALVLQPGPERRRTSSHYTPRSLSAPIVRRTLEPILRVLGPEPTAEQILALKVCDPAMGSGAFLVEACRVLGEAVEAAWRREAKKAGNSAHSELAGLQLQAPGAPTPGAWSPSSEAQLQAPGVATSGAWSSSSRPPSAPPPGVVDLTLEARRRVAEACLYGVDKNPEAVTLAKLSLWLVTLSKDKPFSFLDHALKAGDSLVGLSMAQIEAFSYAPVTPEVADVGQGKAKRKKGDPLPGQLTLFTGLVEGELREAISLRHRLEKLAEQSTPEAVEEKRWLTQDADDALTRVKRIADCVVGAFFAHTKDKDRAAELLRRKEHIEAWIARKAHDEAPTPEILAWQAEVHEKVNVFHWPLEFPEVFWPGRPDPLDGGKVGEPACFDAFVGNPPFMGKNGIVASAGPEYIFWLLLQHEGSHGAADLSAHFLRRGAHLLGQHGTLGFVATNTISQGDTRDSGLKVLLDRGLRIFEARRSLPWPGAAAVTVSIVHLVSGSLRATARLDGLPVETIDSRLEPNPERSELRTLLASDSCWFLGPKVYGEGFFVESLPRHVLSQLEPSCLKAYLRAEDVNASPSFVPSRTVVSFGREALEVVTIRWPNALSLVMERVKPERDQANDATADGAHRKKYWWQFAQPRPDLTVALGSLGRCLVTARVTKHMCFSFQDTELVFSEQLFVFPLEAYTSFAVLQSRVHEPWARLLSSTMEDRLRYSASDCFATFPFPKPDPRAVLPALEAAGEAFYTRRASYMVAENVGLTQTYNRLKDPSNTSPEVAELRALTCAMDRAVLEAYGFGDLEVPPYCALTEDDTRAQKAFAEAVIDRLYALNAERAREEAKGATKAAAGKGRGKKKG